MFSIGEKIIYGENGVCTVVDVAPLPSSGGDSGKLYYHLTPLIGRGVYYAPVGSGAFMRPIISRDEAEALIASIPEIEPAICSDSRFNHVDAFYKELFRQHTCQALVSIIKGLRCRMEQRKSKSSRAEGTLRRAKDILYGELSVALGLELEQVEEYISGRLGGSSGL